MFLKFCEIHRKVSLPESLFNKVAGWKPKTFSSSHWRCFVKQGALKNFSNFTGNDLCWSLFLINLKLWGPATLLKKTQTQVLSSEICKYFEEHLWMSTSKFYLKGDSSIGVSLWILWIIHEHLFCRWFTNGWFWNASAGVSLQ